MRKEPLFSVIMPNHNKGKYIKEAIESVLAQTYSNWELVIVDDASTDNSLEVISTFLNNENTILIMNADNKGVGYTAKLAVENSSGEIIGTLDSDDVLDEDALMVMVNEHMANPEYGLIYSNHYNCDKDLKIHAMADLPDPLPDNLCLQDIFPERPCLSTAFRTFKRNAYNQTEGYDINLLCYEDRDLYYKLEKVSRIKYINRCLYYRRDTNEAGAYRRNPKGEYYWFLCAYKETNRRFGINLPFVNNKEISPFLSNLMYIYLYKYSNINREKLRKRLHCFLLEMGFGNFKNNKLLAFLYFLNSYIYGYTPITFNRIKKFIARELPGK